MVDLKEVIKREFNTDYYDCLYKFTDEEVNYFFEHVPFDDIFTKSKKSWESVASTACDEIIFKCDHKDKAMIKDIDHMLKYLYDRKRELDPEYHFPKSYCNYFTYIATVLRCRSKVALYYGIYRVKDEV